MPEWSPDAAIELMDLLGTTAGIFSVSTPGTGFLDKPFETADMAWPKFIQPGTGEAA